MTLVAGASLSILADLGTAPFILDRDLLDANPGSELTPLGSSLDAIECEVTGASWTWGASDPLGPLTEAEAGRLRLSLVDTERAFDPSNTSSPYWQFLRVGMPLVVTVEGVAAFTGTLEAWQWDVGSSIATLEGIDPLGTLAATVLPAGSTVAAGTSAAQAGAVLDLAGWSATLRVFRGTSAVTRASVAVDGPALNGLAGIRLAELGAFYATRAGSIGWDARVPPAPGAPTVTVNCGGVGLEALVNVFTRSRMRNVVLIDDAAPLRFALTPSESKHGPRTVRSSTSALALTAGDLAGAYSAWASTILTALGEPAVISALGTLVPHGPAQVKPILAAEYGDRWRLVDDEVTPPIDRLVRVLGESVSIGPDAIEVDAVTEDVAA